MVQTSADEELPAGAFLPWLDEIRGALVGERDADVPCGSCTACCTASQFVHIAPDETDALAHIPSSLLFRAPRLPRGHVLMGHDEHGHCPMLVDGRCSIYAHRPRTCRTYDCRVFAAAGLEPDDERKVLIADRARRWRFSFPDGAGRAELVAVRAAATFLVEHPHVLPDGVAASNVTQVAVLAVEVHDAFVAGTPPPDAALVTVRAGGGRVRRGQRTTAASPPPV
ncbi:MAG: YkgJ family cysteine cluster protein [Ilumatobacteraceae bacterium]